MNETDSREKPIESSLAESTRLREENSRLRPSLVEHGIPIPASARNNEALSPMQEIQGERSTPDKAARRIALFRSLFRGRDDVDAVRWERPDGRAGYVPKADRDCLHGAGASRLPTTTVPWNANPRSPLRLWSHQHQWGLEGVTRYEISRPVRGRGPDRLIWQPEEALDQPAAEPFVETALRGLTTR